MFVWIDGDNGFSRSFIGLLHINSVKMATTLKVNEHKTYLFHAVLLNVTVSQWR